MMFRNALISLFLTSTALATTWTVDDDGLDFPKADFNNIQAAVDAASDGDEIVVMPGTYTNSTASSTVINTLGKALLLHSSDGAEVTIIDGEGTRRGIYCGNGETSNTIIEGFTITGGYANEGGGMSNYNSSPTLTNCTFENNTAEWLGGGMYNTDSSPTIENCTFTINSAYNGGGILLVGGSITNCTFTNNHATWGGGASCSNATSVTFCTFTDNIGLQIGGGLVCHGNEVVVNECNIRGNQSGQGGGIFTNHVTGPSISYSIVCGNVDSQIIGAYVDLGGNTIADFCPGNLGTCCTNDICLDSEEEDDCIHFGGQWLGEGTTCENNPCPTSCLGDVTGDGLVNTSDILVIISVWGACP